MVEGSPGTGNLNLWFQELMVSSGRGKKDGEGVVMIGWKDIPIELLLRIVSVADDERMVISVSGVCTGWRDALCVGLTHLSLSWCKAHMNSLVMSLVPKFTKLQVLNLRQNRPQLEDNAVEAIANYCHDLLDLDLCKSLRLSDSSLYALAHGCPNLMKLNISGCSAFSDSALAYLTSCCRNLKNLNLCGCVRAATDRALQAVAQNCSQLQYLNLGWCEGVTDKGVISLALGCPELKALDLCGCVLITGTRFTQRTYEHCLWDIVKPPNQVFQVQRLPFSYGLEIWAQIYRLGVWKEKGYNSSKPLFWWNKSDLLNQSDPEVPRGHSGNRSFHPGRPVGSIWVDSCLESKPI